MRLPLALTAAAGLALSLAAPAGAAYAPKLSVKLDPATRLDVPAVTTRVTQRSGETPSKTVKVMFPEGMTLRSDGVFAPCTPAQESAKACPEPSRLGKATAVTGLGTFRGNVYNAGFDADGRLRLVAWISNGLALLDQKLQGLVVPERTGFVASFDNLPDVAVTDFTLALEAGTKGLLVNPRTCGRFTFKAAFTSHKGERATDEAAVDITGCPPPKPRFTTLAFPKRLKAGRRATLRLRADHDLRTTVTLKRGSKRIGRKRITLPAGETYRLKIGSGLRPGAHRIEVRGVAKDGQVVKRTKRFRVVR